MIPRFRPRISWQELFRGGTNDPNALTEFESVFSRQIGLPETVWFPYGRVGVRAFLEGLQNAKKKVVLSPFNCVALGNAVACSSWAPLYVDTENEGFNQDSASFSEALDRKDVGAGIVVSQWGIPADLKIDSAAQKPLLHDFALKPVGGRVPPLGEQDAVLYSFGWGKPMGFLRGAVLCGQSREVADRWRQWRDQRLLPASEVSERLELFLLKTLFQPVTFGLAWRMADSFKLARRLSGRESEERPGMPENAFRALSSGTLANTLVRVSKVKPSIDALKALISNYEALLGSFEGHGLRLPNSNESLSHYPVRTGFRDSLATVLLRNRIFASKQLFSRLLPDYPWLNGEQIGELRNARKLTLETLHLPMFLGITQRDQEKIAEVVCKHLRRG